MTNQPPGNTQETTPGTTPPPGDGGTGGTTPAPSGGKTAAELEAQYIGLQKSYQKMKESSDSKIADVTSKLQEATTQIEELKQGVSSKDSQLTTLVKQSETLTQQLEALKSEKSVSDANYSRSLLIMGQFPELAVWEAQGLIPKGKDEEETKQILTKFRETMTGQIGKSVKDTMSGAVPPGSGKNNLGTDGSSGEESKDYLMSKMLETAGRNEKEYKEWQAKYDAVLAKEASKN